MRVLLRCDGGGSLGVGHVMRSLALAEAAVAAGHDVLVAGRFEGAFLQRQLSPRNLSPIDVVQLAGVPASAAGPDPILALVERFGPDVLHVDSYDLPGWLMGSFVVSNMEDGTFGRRPADVVVDPTIGAELAPRPEDGSTWFLRGSRYTPVRHRVIDARRDTPVRDAARRVLVVMGGTDPVGLTPVAVDLLARTGLALEVTAIAVGENAGLARVAAEGSALRLDVLAPVDDLAAMMSASDLVISAAGTSIWELCCIGVPTALAWVVDNQREGYDRVVAAGAAIGLGGPGLGGGDRAVDQLRKVLTDTQVRADLVRAGRQVVDGLGAWRVVAMWEQAGRQAPRQDQRVPSPPATRDTGLVARPATFQDSRQLWQWRNDPVTRAGSRSSAEVPWDDHLRWLNATLSRTDRLLLVVYDGHDRLGPVGTARWDLRSEGEWEVSVTVAPDRRGQSLAGPTLRAAEVALTERSGGTDVTAYLAVVHVDNPASRRLFETSGYAPDLPPDPQGFMQYRKYARVP